MFRGVLGETTEGGGANKVAASLGGGGVAAEQGEHTENIFTTQSNYILQFFWSFQMFTGHKSTIKEPPLHISHRWSVTVRLEAAKTPARW